MGGLISRNWRLDYRVTAAFTPISFPLIASSARIHRVTMAALDTLLQKVPKKVLVFLIGFLVVVLVLVLAVAVLVQKRPVDVWGLRLGESVGDLQRKLAAAETELRGRSAQAETRAQDLLREIDQLKRTVAEMQATARKAATTSDLWSAPRSSAQVGSLS